MSIKSKIAKETINKRKTARTAQSARRSKKKYTGPRNRPKCKLQDLIDIEQFQMLQDRLNNIYSFPSAIIDNEGKILTATAWQDVCTQFHRMNKECEQECIKSDQYILAHLAEAHPAVSYQCPHGLVDNATPIIIDGVHYGSFFTGQFFLEKPDLEFFRKQAKRYGFDEAAYLEAIKRVPIWSQKQLENYLFFIRGLIEVISTSGSKRLKEIETRQKIETTEERADAILTQTLDGFWITEGQNGRIIDVNAAMCRMLGYTHDEMLKMSVAEVEVLETPQDIQHRAQQIIQDGSANFESCLRHKDGSLIEVEVSVTYLPSSKLLFGFHHDITERKRNEDELQSRAEQFAALLEVSQALTRTLSLPKVLQVITEEAAAMLKLETSAIYLLDGNSLYLGATTPPLPHDFPEEFRNAKLDDHPHINRAIETGTSVLVPDTTAVNLTPAEKAIADARNLRTILYIPLMVDEKAVGVLIVGYVGKQGEFSEGAIDMCRTLSNQAALAVTNARLYENQTHYISELEDQIAERVKAEQQVIQLARLYAVLSQINQVIVRVKEPHELYQSICKVSVEYGKFSLAWIGLYDDRTHIIKPIASYGQPEIRLPLTGFNVTHAPYKNSIFVKALHTSMVMTSDDIRAEQQETALRRQLADAGLRSDAVVPFKLQGIIIGFLHLVSDEPGFFKSEDEIRLLEETGLDISFALDTMAVDEERRQMDEALKQSQEQFRAAVQTANDAIITIDSQHKIVFWNAAAERIFGFSADEMLGQPKIAILPHQFRQSDIQAVEQFFVTGESHLIGKTIEMTALNKEGREFPIEMSLAEWKTPAGHFVTAIIRDTTERKQHENELQVIATLSAALRAAPSRAEMLPVIVERSVNLLDCNTVAIEIIEAETGDTILEAAHGIWESLVGTRQVNGTGLNAIISRTLSPYLTHNLATDQNLTYPAWTRQGIRGCAGVPLIAQDVLIGFIWIGRLTDISETEVRLLTAIADIAANAIHRATLHEQTQKDAAELRLAYDSTLEGWAHALELRDHVTEGHTRRVVDATLKLARAAGITGEALENIRRGALLHDVGKMGIPDSVLLKPGTLNEREWEIMHRHPEYAYNLITPIEYLRAALDIPYYHHERWDGSGYPHGLKGNGIPLAARIFAVVDVWDALRSDRPYRKGWPEEKVINYIRAQSGIHFDPEVVDLFLKVFFGDR